MTKIRLTKSRLRALDTALCLDDILYEKFRRLNEGLAAREDRFRRGKEVVQVLQETGQPGVLQAMMVVRVNRSAKGQQVIVR